MGNLDKYTGSMVCSKQLYKEALNHTFDEPKHWEIREITNEDRCKFVLWVGNKRLIKRRLFDQFIEQAYSI